MVHDTKVITCSTGDGFRKRFAELDPFCAAETTPNTSPESCCGSLTRQANYPRPTITERHDDIVSEIDARFSVMARAYGESAEHLRNWVGNGNQLPKVYR